MGRGKTQSPSWRIRVIVRGNTMAGLTKKVRKTYLHMVQSVQISEWPPKMTRVDSPIISFTTDDARQLHPHNDALVITLTIANFTTRRVLVDNGSSMDILYYLAF